MIASSAGVLPCLHRNGEIGAQRVDPRIGQRQRDFGNRRFGKFGIVRRRVRPAEMRVVFVPDLKDQFAGEGAVGAGQKVGHKPLNLGGIGGRIAGVTNRRKDHRKPGPLRHRIGHHVVEPRLPGLGCIEPIVLESVTVCSRLREGAAGPDNQPWIKVIGLDIETIDASVADVAGTEGEVAERIHTRGQHPGFQGKNRQQRSPERPVYQALPECITALPECG